MYHTISAILTLFIIRKVQDDEDEGNAPEDKDDAKDNCGEGGEEPGEPAASLLPAHSFDNVRVFLTAQLKVQKK